MNYVLDLLDSVRKARIEHVVFGSFQRSVLGVGPEPKRVSILTSDSKALIRILDAKPDYTNSRKKSAYFSLTLPDESTFSALIYDKGKNVFPERFESEMMASAIVIHNKFLGLDIEHEFWASIYSQVVHQGMFTPPVRSLYIQKIKERIGLPLQPKYDNLKSFREAYATPLEVFED